MPVYHRWRWTAKTPHAVHRKLSLHVHDIAMGALQHLGSILTKIVSCTPCILLVYCCCLRKGGCFGFIFGCCDCCKCCGGVTGCENLATTPPSGTKTSALLMLTLGGTYLAGRALFISNELCYSNPETGFFMSLRAVNSSDAAFYSRHTNGTSVKGVESFPFNVLGFGEVKALQNSTLLIDDTLFHPHPDHCVMLHYPRQV